MADKQNTAEIEASKNNGSENKNYKLPLFYSKPTPLDSTKHSKLSLKKDFGFGYTKEVNAIPINIIEMPQICHFYPIAFSPDDSATPLAIVGLRDNENLFVDENGKWTEGVYIPAYVRRYPFIFSEIPESDQLTLCIDYTDDVMEENGPQPLFNDDNSASELTKNALEFCKSYHSAARHSMEFSKAILENDLLVKRDAQINVGNNKRVNFSGFNIIDEKKLSQMDDNAFLDLRNKGWLPFIYAQLFSGTQWGRLSFMLNQRLSKEES